MIPVSVRVALVEKRIYFELFSVRTFHTRKSTLRLLHHSNLDISRPPIHFFRLLKGTPYSRNFGRKMLISGEAQGEWTNQTIFSAEL